MNVLILGSGGREHTIAWKIRQSPILNQLYIAPGNAGTNQLGINLNIAETDFDALKKAVLQHHISLVIVGPENPLVLGIHDYFEHDNQLKNCKVIGPKKEGAQLEGSKEFAKEFMYRHHIPTAKYKSFSKDSLAEAFDFLHELKPPYVLKADGLAAGKGVLIVNTIQEAQQELTAMLSKNKFGNAGNKVVIEEYLNGIEMSCFVLTDGKEYVILPNAKDYKRIGEGDTGLNTGGMGAISPVPFATPSILEEIEKTIIIPSIKGLQKDKIDFVGFLFIGLMLVDKKPFVIEYNVRLGDPETEVVIPRIESDLLELFTATTKGNLAKFPLKTNPKTAATVMAVSGGYPEAYEKGKWIKGVENIDDSLVFYAGIKQIDNQLVTAGGRVLAITSFGENFEEAVKKSYTNIEKIHFEKINFRKDIGFDLQTS